MSLACLTYRGPPKTNEWLASVCEIAISYEHNINDHYCLYTKKIWMPRFVLEAGACNLRHPIFLVPRLAYFSTTVHCHPKRGSYDSFHALLLGTRMQFLHRSKAATVLRNNSLAPKNKLKRGPTESTLQRLIAKSFAIQLIFYNDP
jgi:hypothetical protein